MLRHGSAVLSEAELLATVFAGPSLDRDLVLADQVLAAAGGLSGLPRADLRLLVGGKLDGCRLALLAAAIELGRRLARAGLPKREPLTQPGRVAAYVALRYCRFDQEVMGALYVDNKNRLLCDRELYRGTINRAAVEPREVLKEGLLRGAAGTILFHTHPSGDPTPSDKDVQLTRRMAEAGEIVGIRLLDHLVVGSADRWVSLREQRAW